MVFINLYICVQVAGTPNNFVKKHCEPVGWDAQESYYSSGSSSNEHGQKTGNTGKGSSPSTPLTTAVRGKRRKGIPRRAPTGGLIIED